tara:strand:+ start:5988 stop:7526 length:1539 start_codon:yes stop_codon:yes gene_type:complete
MNECNLCRYIESETDPNKQTCSKWVNNDDVNLPCLPTGGNPGDNPNDENDNCQRIECPSHCQYPFTKQVYNDGDHPNEHYDNLRINPAFRYLKNNPALLEAYLSNATNNDMVKDSLKTYNSQNIPENLNLRCGDLLSPEGDKSYDFPDLPTSDILRRTIDHHIEVSNKGIDWSSIKRTEKLDDEYGSGINVAENYVVINSYTIPLSENGIELEWWDREQLTGEQLKQPLPTSIREYNSLEKIHLVTGGILEYIFPEHTSDKMVIEEIYDWLMKNNLEEQDENEGNRITMAEFFGIRADDVTNRDFEVCMNQLMITEHDDDEYLRRINSYTNLTDLGDPNNRKDLFYIEAKINKFLILDTSKVGKCLDIVYLTDEICKIGLTSTPTQMMGKFLKLNTDNVDDETYNDKMRIVTKRLLKYLPRMVQKMIDISEYYEKQKCNNELHTNTILLKEIYTSLFTKNSMKIELPTLGLGDFFKDFEENIYTKIILLIFIAYTITQFIKLFTVNFNIGSK